MIQESSVYWEFKSVATITPGNCTLYSLMLNALLVPLRPLKEIVHHSSSHVLEPDPRSTHGTGKRCPGTLPLASLPNNTVLTALASVHIEQQEDQERNRSFSSLFISVDITLTFLSIPDQLLKWKTYDIQRISEAL